MNSIYRSIWNKKTGTFVAVSEHTSASGKQSSTGSETSGRSAGFIVKALGVSLILAFSTLVQALPAGGVVAAGAASIGSVAGNTTVTQSSQNAVINWDSFNIAQGEAVRFLQPNGSSVALNRVLGSDPSSLFGSLYANGKVFLINPNGVLFGQGAQINVGGLVASTLNVSDSDFMAGRYRFAGNSDASILNQGNINADGGYVALLGAKVSNDGVILARLGTVALAAGKAITLDFAGDGLLNVTVDQGAVNALVSNGGLIQADGGNVLLTAQGAGNLLQSAVNNSGVIQAQSIENDNGSIRLLGDAVAGTVTVGGVLNVSGTDTGELGGAVTATGQHVALVGAQIHASGDAGGGTVLIGGDYRGLNPLVQNAAATYMSADSSIYADALTHGDGGKIILWANEATRAYGNISALGGTLSGDGGLVETSAHYLDVNGMNVRASAPNGKGGTWLLDPNNITIQAAGAETNVTASPTFTSTNDTAIVTTATIETALNAGTSVTVTTGSAGTNAQTGDISVNSTLTYTAVAGPTLTLTALGNVNINATVTPTTGSFVVNAGGNITVASATTATTGNLTYKAGGNVSITSDTTVTTGTISAIAGGTVTVANPMTVTTGDIVLRGDNDGTGPGAVLGGTVAVNCAANCLTITTGNLRVRFNPVTYASTAAEIASYGTKLTGGGALDAKAWVFGKGDNKTYDATTTATVTGLKPDIGGVAPAGAVLGAVTNANFDTKDVGVSKLITYDSTFAHATFDLFAPIGTAAGSYTTRANITQAPLSITAFADSKTYNGVAYGGGNGVTYASFVGGETAAVLGGALSYGGTAQGASNAGSYSITPAGQTSTNYAISNVAGTLTITPASLTITASNVSKAYGATPTLSAFTAAGLVAGETIGSVTETSPGALAGATAAGNPYAITPSGATGGTFTPANYVIAYVNGVLTVLTSNLVITASDVTKIYGQTPVLSGFSATGLLNGDTVGSVTEVSPGQVATAAVAGSPYSITPSAATGGSFVPANYTISYVDGALTVVPAAMTITASNVSKAYGQTPTLSAFTAAGLVNGDTVGSVIETSPGTVATATVAGSPYVITPSGATGGSFTPANYTIAYINGVLTVVPNLLTITASNVVKNYGETPTLSAFTTAGLVNGDTVGSVTETSTGTVATASVAGNPYPIVPTDATGGTFTPANYTIAYVNGVLTVIPVGLVVTSNDGAIAFGQTPPLTGFTSVGLVNGEAIGSVTQTTATTGVGASVVDTTAITPSDATGGTFTPSNYVISYVPGELTVTPRVDETPVDVPPTRPDDLLTNKVPPWVPIVVLPRTPPQLLALLPPEQPVAEPLIVKKDPPPVLEPIAAPPQIYVAPVRVRKQDRN